jgi:hypothetical protein
MDGDFDIPSFPAVSGARKRERSFELSLPALVKGRDAADREFAEQTEISSLSSQEAVFRLDTRVMTGAKLVLHLQVPRTFLLEKPLELGLSGTVAVVRADIALDSKSQVVSIRLDRDFQIQSQTC